jgi:hypothetical protein
MGSLSTDTLRREAKDAQKGPSVLVIRNRTLFAPFAPASNSSLGLIESTLSRKPALGHRNSQIPLFVSAPVVHRSLVAACYQRAILKVEARTFTAAAGLTWRAPSRQASYLLIARPQPRP